MLSRLYETVRAALIGKHDTLVLVHFVTTNFFACWPSGAPCQPGALRIHLTRLSTEGLGPRHGEVRRAHQMFNAALRAISVCCVRRTNDRPPASRMI